MQPGSVVAAELLQCIILQYSNTGFGLAADCISV